MRNAAHRANVRKLIIMAVLVLLAAAAYMLVEVNFGSEKLFLYAMKIRTPKLIAMLITAFAIGGASIVFQSIINNTIVTPCLLGMNSLYTLIHTAGVFAAGSGSLLAMNSNLAFAVDLLLMGIAATVIYSYLFKKTNHNVLYVLLIGTVLTSFFGSIQTTLTRVMDPNEYDTLLATLVASFSNINSEIIAFSLVVLAAVIFALRKELALLDVLTLGKDQATNLGVDYDRCIRRLLLGVTLHRRSHGDGGADLVPRADYCEPLAPAFKDLPAQPADSRLRLFRHDRARGRTAYRGARIFLRDPGQRIHHCRRRHLFPVSAAGKKEGMSHARARTYKEI